MISIHAMFLTVNQFAQCIKHEWKICSTFSPPATVILLLFLTFEALLFAVFTMIMLGTQLTAIWNDETVRRKLNLQQYKFINFSLFCAVTGHRTIEKRRGSLGAKIKMEEYSIGFRSIFTGLVFTVFKTNN